MNKIKLLLNERALRILAFLNETKRFEKSHINLTTIVKTTDTTYAYCHFVVNLLQEYNLVIQKKQGRNKFISLTKAGERFSKHIYDYVSYLETTEEHNNKRNKK